jgi:3-phenylpropionate/trans-cinnamate dioxygenase ferredoxin reductase component
MDPESICIVGAGQAGCELALSLRQQGWKRGIVLIGEEAHRPYQRPALSKAYLKGCLDAGALGLRKPEAYVRAQAALRLNVRVERIDRDARTLALSDGDELRYSRLALTTGGRPQRLPLPQPADDSCAAYVHYLRSLDDAARLRARFAPGRRLVVIGGGYIGLEVAATAVESGLLVTVLEAAPRVLARVTAPSMSDFFEAAHRGAGVDLRTSVAVREIRSPAGEGRAIVCCSGGVEVTADIVVAGVGLAPNTGLAEAAGLAIDNGVTVDECMLTSDPLIAAAGDCTSFPHAPSGRRIRLESVQNAIEQARSAAAALIGKPRPLRAVPWFWSDQFDMKLQIAGLSQGHDSTIIRGSMSERSFATFYLSEGRLIACDAVNRPREFMWAKRVIGDGCDFDATALADESVPLERLAAAASPRRESV